jgi:7,8-dihydropterin-6-yl-methyl-4-(beta-D-ribofuranosyl)aminobenzene 5'-phosphate synthase
MNRRRITIVLFLCAIMFGCNPSKPVNPPSLSPKEPTALHSTITILPSPTVTPPEPTTTITIPTVTESPSPSTIPGVRITLLYDNTTYDERLTADWGFSALIEYGEHTILFDTGYNGEILKGNMELLGIDPQPIEAIVLSHIHQDHVGGLKTVLNMGITPKVYIPVSFPDEFKNRYKEDVDLIEVLEPIKIVPGVYSTGQLGSTIMEQGLLLVTQEGNVVITGCAHPGVVRIVREAKKIQPGDIALVLGGFHLGGASEYQVETIINQFQENGVIRVCPCHCTGENAIAWFENAYGEDYVEGGAGRILEIGGAPTP